MPIYPLPQFEADLKAQLNEEDRLTYESLKAPRSVVVRFGSMKYVGEFPYTGQEKPGCGSKIVVRTFRGTEIGEMLTSTCPNSGCSKSVSRKEMLQYIQNSGGRDYPFYTEGKALRIADRADMDAQAKLDQSRHELRLRAKAAADRAGVAIKIVEAEPILGGETLTFFYLSEERIELRDVLGELISEFGGHVELRHVGARDEARLTADYERCGQYCCCKNFLKVLKPVSIKSAKVQKATLDPLKISGRCGRLMCCLRYEDQTYEELRQKLPRRKSRVGTPDGDGVVMDAQILTQLVLVRLDQPDATGKFVEVAVPVEDLTPPNSAVALPPAPPRPYGGDGPRERSGRGPSRGPAPGPRDRPRREPQPSGEPPAGDTGGREVSAGESPEARPGQQDRSGERRPDGRGQRPARGERGPRRGPPTGDGRDRARPSGEGAADGRRGGRGPRTGEGTDRPPTAEGEPRQPRPPRAPRPERGGGGVGGGGGGAPGQPPPEGGDRGPRGPEAEGDEQRRRGRRRRRRRPPGAGEGGPAGGGEGPSGA
jgi:cell fate regulator YaaT (PSP1 superfamily)